MATTTTTNLSDPNDRLRLYERVLTVGTEQDIEYYIKLDLLVEAWDARAARPDT